MVSTGVILSVTEFCREHLRFKIAKALLHPDQTVVIMSWWPNHTYPLIVASQVTVTLCPNLFIPCPCLLRRLQGKLLRPHPLVLRILMLPLYVERCIGWAMLVAVLILPMFLSCLNLILSDDHSTHQAVLNVDCATGFFHRDHLGVLIESWKVETCRLLAFFHVVMFSMRNAWSKQYQRQGKTTLCVHFARDRRMKIQIPDRVFSKLRNGFPKLRPFSEDELSRSCDCAQAGGCVEGALRTPSRNTTLLLNWNWIRKTLSLKCKEFPGKLRKNGPYSAEQGAVGSSKTTSGGSTKWCKICM